MCASGRWGCGSRLWSRNVRPGRRGVRKSTPVEKRAPRGRSGVRKSTLVEKRASGAGWGRGSRLRSRNVGCGVVEGVEVDSGRETCGRWGRWRVRKSTLVEKRAAAGPLAGAEVDSGREMLAARCGGRVEVDSGRETSAWALGGAEVDSGRETVAWAYRAARSRLRSRNVAAGGDRRAVGPADGCWLRSGCEARCRRARACRRIAAGPACTTPGPPPAHTRQGTPDTCSLTRPDRPHPAATRPCGTDHPPIPPPRPFPPQTATFRRIRDRSYGRD